MFRVGVFEKCTSCHTKCNIKISFGASNDESNECREQSQLVCLPYESCNSVTLGTRIVSGGYGRHTWGLLWGPDLCPLDIFTRTMEQSIKSPSKQQPAITEGNHLNRVMGDMNGFADDSFPQTKPCSVSNAIVLLGGICPLWLDAE